MSSPWMWFASRACGVVALVLLTVVVVLGVVAAIGVRPDTAVPTVTVGLHRIVGIGTVVFVLTHILLAVLDTYVNLGRLTMLVPFLAGYHRIWVGVGTVTFDLFVLVLVTSVLRLHMSHRTWRAVHWLSYALAACAAVHGFMMSADDQPAFRIVTVVCAAVMGIAAGCRLCVRDPDRRRRAEIASGEWT
ncbi:ferric reductase-like transmembrane domain-containing protein [Gordonia sp. DT30]|uniref:ferric reductase-like transmembrane domain-containing protein n=1 Tax=unclassified Gordonia (in: high G+C Gram-positive bacteria) TaxID=2657482 RepID=UPI003CF3FA09